MLRLPDNTIKVLIEGKKRAKIETFNNDKDGYSAEVVHCEDVMDDQVKG